MFKDLLLNIRRSSYVMIGGIILIVLLLSALFAPLLAPHDPYQINGADRLQAPSAQYLLGTDNLGRDILSRLLYGTQVSMIVGFSCVAIALTSGIIVGLLCGYYPKADKIVMRFLDACMAFPDIIVAITLSAIWGSGKTSLIIALSIAYFPRMARTVRGSALAIKEMEYIESARAVGCNAVYILSRYILPNCLSPIIIQAAFIFAIAILGEAALSFLGVGIPYSTATWGGMLSESRNYIDSPWMMIFPGAAIAISVLGLNLLGDGLRDLLDPRLRDL